MRVLTSRDCLMALDLGLFALLIELRQSSADTGNLLRHAWHAAERTEGSEQFVLVDSNLSKAFLVGGKVGRCECLIRGSGCHLFLCGVRKLEYLFWVCEHLREQLQREPVHCLRGYLVVRVAGVIAAIIHIALVIRWLWLRAPARARAWPTRHLVPTLGAIHKAAVEQRSPGPAALSAWTAAILEGS